MKRCPYCAEEIQDEAIKCKHCGEKLGRTNIDTLDRAVTISSKESPLQYDTLDVAATIGGEATILANQYRIIKKIGEGGMGIVYLAEDTEMGNRPVAIKVLPPLLSKNIRAVENLRKEAITAINLNHPHIIRLYGFHSDADIKFLVMEYIDGQTLEEKISESSDGKLSLEETVEIAEKVAAALDYAHSRRPPVFHRDLKPSNIMISKDSDVKLLDFGIAREMHDSYTRVTGKADTSGTLPYMSPEQLRGQKPTSAMDIYSFGVVCYECLCGHPPFHTGQIEYQIINETPIPLDCVPDYINDTLQKALAKEAINRPKTTIDIVSLLKRDFSIETQQLAPERPNEAMATKQKHGVSVAAKSSPKAGNVTTNSIGMRLVYIPSGEFMMGSPVDERHRNSDEGPVHKVRISKGFYMGIHEVTQAQYKSIVGNNPSYFKGNDLPVETVSWNDATEFCTRLSQKEGKTYRLPTEAEWEYACRAGTTTPYSFGTAMSKDDANFFHWFKTRTKPVGSYKPNAFGLYDMHGNVRELCQDYYGNNYYSTSPDTDPKGPDSGQYRVIRGGFWGSEPLECRSALRNWNLSDFRSYYNGFRVVMETGE